MPETSDRVPRPIGWMNTHLPTPPDYYRPVRARELRRRAAGLDRCVLGMVLVYFGLVVVEWFNYAPFGAVLLALEGGVVGVPLSLGLWMAAEACGARAARLDRDHQSRLGGQAPPAVRRRRFTRPKLPYGPWLLGTTLVSLVLIWMGGLRIAWRSSYSYFEGRIYSAGSPGRPIPWYPAPRGGLNCQHRMIFTGHGEVARSLRLGDLVVEVSQSEGMGLESLVLDGADCH